MPRPQPVQLDGQKLDVVPARQFADAIAQFRRDAHNRRPKRFDALCLHSLRTALGNDIGALPIVAAVDHHENRAGANAAERLGAVARSPRDPHPQHVDRRAKIFDREAGPFAHD